MDVPASGPFGGVYIALTGVLLIWSTQVYVDEPARGVGLAFLLLALGQAGAAPALGILVDLAGLAAAFWAGAALALVACLLAPRVAHWPESTEGASHGQRVGTST